MGSITPPGPTPAPPSPGNVNPKVAAARKAAEEIIEALKHATTDPLPGIYKIPPSFSKEWSDLQQALSQPPLSKDEALQKTLGVMGQWYIYKGKDLESKDPLGKLDSLTSQMEQCLKDLAKHTYDPT